MFKIVNFYIHFSLFFSNVFFLFTETNIIGKINNLFVFSTPFICEFLLFVISIWYIIICCFSNMKWWDSHIIFRLFFWIKKFFLFLFFINLYSIINYSIIETGLFFGNNLINDFITVVIKSFLILILFFCVTKWFTFIFINYKNWKSINEFALIFLSSSFFLCVLPSINDLFLVVYLIIAMSICIYGLILLNVPIISSSAETGAKYFLLSVISVGLMYGGIKEIYIYLGSLNFTIINNNIFEHLINCSSYKELFSIKFGLIFIVLGFFFKLSAAPNHFWAPEVYAGLPYELLMFIIIPVKFIISFIFLRIIKVVFFIFAVNKNINLILLNEIEFFIYLSVILSMIIGAVNAFFEHNLRKFIAYSSINQIGFLLIGLLGFNSDIFGFESFFYFLFIYVLNLLFFFLYIIGFSQTFYIPLYIYTIFYEFFVKYKNFTTKEFNYFIKDFSFVNNIRITFLIDLKKIFYMQNLLLEKTKFLKLSFLIIIIFSLAGVPPFMGFYGKFYILLYSIQLKYWSILIIGILTSILSVFYYLRFLKIMFFEKMDDLDFAIFSKHNFLYTSLFGEKIENTIFLFNFQKNKNFSLTSFFENIKEKKINSFFSIFWSFVFIFFPFFETFVLNFISKMVQNLLFLYF